MIYHSLLMMMMKSQNIAFWRGRQAGKLWSNFFSVLLCVLRKKKKIWTWINQNFVCDPNIDCLVLCAVCVCVPRVENLLEIFLFWFFKNKRKIIVCSWLCLLNWIFNRAGWIYNLTIFLFVCFNFQYSSFYERLKIDVRIFSFNFFYYYYMAVVHITINYRTGRLLLLFWWWLWLWSPDSRNFSSFRFYSFLFFIQSMVFHIGLDQQQNIMIT